MSSISETLEKIANIFEGKGVPMRQHLRPGLSRAEIQAALAPLGLVPPEELYELYEWHDGVDDYYEPGLLLGEHQFIPLKDAIYEYHETLKYYEDPSLNLAKCFPVAFFMGSSYNVYCDPVLFEGLQYPVIRIFEGIGVEFENLTLMAQTVLAWFEADIYDGDGPADDKLMYGIRGKLNPRVQYGVLLYNFLKKLFVKWCAYSKGVSI